MRPKVLVFGPLQPVTVACGINSAIRAFIGSRIQQHFDIELVSTYRPEKARRLIERLAYGVYLVVATAMRMLRSAAILADIHTASGRSFLSNAAVVFGVRLVGRPALLRIHGGEFQAVFENAGSVQRNLIRFILRSATRVIVLSENWRSRVATIEPRAAIEVIPNPVDCRAYERLADRPARPCRRILFLANLCEQKGHFDALKAMAKLVSDFPDTVLALAGADRDPGARQLLETEAARLGIQDRIEFLGTVSGETKEQAIHDADVLILPSHTENMPVSLIEGMAAALPVIGTSVGAIPEMIEDGETGFLIRARHPDELAERLSRLFRDPELGRCLGRRAQVRAREKWDADMVADRSIALYTNVS